MKKLLIIFVKLTLQKLQTTLIDGVPMRTENKVMNANVHKDCCLKFLKTMNAI